MTKLTEIKHLVSMYSEFLPTVLKNLKYSCETFKAGQIAEHCASWRELTNDKTILSDVLGCDIECTVTSVQQRLPAQKFSKQEFPIVKQEICKLVHKGVISKATYTPGQFVSSIFLRPKKDGSLRLILNFKKFNKTVAYHHFKMNSLHTIIKLVTKNCFMASRDLKDAYYSIPVRQADRKFERFKWEDELYEFTCLPNGLSCASRKFNKILKPPLAYLHKKGHISVAHLDDLYLQGQSYEQCVHNVIDTTVLFDFRSDKAVIAWFTKKGSLVKVRL